jgi:lysophospholipase L1-like esterase
MPDGPVLPQSGSFFGAAFTPRRILINSAMFFYCLALFLIFDFAYSSFTRGDERELNPRRYDPVYGHDLNSKFDGYDVWGEKRYRLITNSLGFKDASTRDVPLTSDAHRILLMGDSFTEAIGMPFESSFGGLLSRAGEERPDKIEFLNAGVSDYSPINYYKKIKYLLDRGLKFDEVVLLSDNSDVFDEATSKFCIDDDPKYHTYCTVIRDPMGKRPATRTWDETFVTTNRVRVLLKFWIQLKLGNRRKALESDFSHASWTMASTDLAKYRPLGIDGGIARSIQNMTKLSDLLASRGIPLTIVTYPWPQQIARNDRDSRQAALWRSFCPGHCKAFIDLFPVYFAAADRDKDWYQHLYIFGDVHFSAAGNRIMYEELAKRLMP